MTTETHAIPRESLTLVEHGLFPIRISRQPGTSGTDRARDPAERGQLTDRGAFTAITSPHTGRSPKDKFVIEEAGAG